MPASTILKTGYCALCRSRCGARFEVDGDVLVAAHPEPNHPTGAALCTKGRAAPEIRANPNRLLHPMRRTKPKGSADPGWTRISWDEALDEIAARLGELRDRDGPEAVAFAMTTSSGTPISDSNEWIDRFIRVFGSPNTVNGTEICNWHKDNVHQLTNGSGVMYPDYVNTDLVFLWGFNPSATWLDQATQVAAARARGAKVISVDPRSAGFAGSATQWLKVRPGADGALALGMICATVAAGGYDAAFVKRWTSAGLLVREDTGRFLRGEDIGLTDSPAAYVAWNGAAVLYDAPSRTFDGPVDELQLRGQIRIGAFTCRPAFDILLAAAEAYTPERIEAETEIPPEDFSAAVRLFVEAKSVAYYCWSGLGQHANASQTDRAVALLMALNGCQDAPGGNVAFTKVPSNPVGGPALTAPAQLAKAVGLAARPRGPATIGWVRGPDIYSAILDHEPYAVKALMSFGSNFAVSQGDGGRATEALKALEFHVHCDVLESPTARFADILLPVNTPWEREGLRVGFEISQEAESLVQLRQRMVPPSGESRSDAEIVFSLATRMGFDEAFFGGDFDRARDWQLAPSGLTVAMLRARPEGISVPQVQRHRKYAETVGTGRRGFATETGLIEIYSEVLQRIGQPPVPVFETRAADPRFPLVMTTFKSPYFCHSQYRDIPSLRRRHKVPRASVHPQTAEALGLMEGETVELSTANGAIRLELALDKHLSRNAVIADYGWWQANGALGLPGYDPFSPQGANYNRLVSASASDPVSGSVAHRAVACALRAVEGPVRGWNGFRAARIVLAERVAEDCLRLGFALEKDHPLPDYEPGQHIVLSVPDPAGGPDIVRCYSLVGPAVDPERRAYVVTVRRQGRMSNLLHERLKPGDTVAIRSPKGRFTLPFEGDEPVVMIAGGIGITPFLGYLETLAALGIDRRVHLTYVTRNSAGHAYAARLKELAGRIPGLSVTTLYTAPLPADRQAHDYDRQGRFTADDVLPPVLAEAGPLFFHCGPPAMMQAVEDMLHARGVPSARIFSEAFGANVQAPPADLPGGPFTVVFSRSGKRIAWEPSAGTILQAAEKEGISLTSGCRAGQCESCAVAVLDGTVRHPGVEEADEDADRCLTCSAVPTSDLVLDA